MLRDETRSAMGGEWDCGGIALGGVVGGGAVGERLLVADFWETRLDWIEGNRMMRLGGGGCSTRGDLEVGANWGASIGASNGPDFGVKHEEQRPPFWLRWMRDRGTFLEDRGFRFESISDDRYVNSLPVAWARGLSVTAPDWFAMAVLMVLPAWRIFRWRRGRGVVGNVCRQCGYDLRASPERCPECGMAVERAGT